MIRYLLLSITAIFTMTFFATAHEIRPGVADVEILADEARMSVRMPLEPLVAGINLAGIEDTNDAPEAALYDALRALEPIELDAAFREAWPQIREGFIFEVDGTRLTPEISGLSIPEIGNLELPRDATLSLSVPLPEGDAPVQIGWSPSYGELVLRQIGGGEDAYEDFLTGGALSEALPRQDILTEGAGSVFLRYVVAGFEHIIPLGMDHILFVLGLFFFALKWRPLLLQVSAFTLAHTITLALASLEIVSVPASIVEPLIAATIVYVGIENATGWGTTKSRTILVFAFGLLHGLGFASVLGDFGIATERFAVALVGFNIGVELGQLAVILLAFLAVGYWFGKKPWYSSVIAIPASLVIAAIGAYWFIERTLL